MSIFGWEHLTYLTVIFTLMIVALILIKKFVKNEKTLTILIKSVAGLLLLSVILNRTFIVFKYSTPDFIAFLPNTFCGLSSFVFSISVLLTKKNANVLHFVYYIAFVGGAITLIYPDFIQNYPSLFSPIPFTGLLHHTVMLFLCLLLITTHYFTPSLKKWFYIPLGLCCYMTWGLFLYDIVGISAMNIHKSFEGIAGLTWFNVGLSFIAGCVLYLVVYELLKKIILKRKSVKK